MTGYVYLAFFLMLTGIWFVLLNVRGSDANFHFVLANTTILFFILIPALTMRIFCEEKTKKTDALLFTSPLTIGEIVLGKFFAAFSLFLIGVAATMIFPFVLKIFGEIPVSQIAGTYVGFILLGAACIAVGIFISALTENQIVAAVATMGAIFAMFLIESIAASMPNSTNASFVFVAIVIVAFAAVWYNAAKKFFFAFAAALIAIIFAAALYFYDNLIFDGIIVRTAMWFSIFARFNFFSRGIIRLSDVVFYFSSGALFIFFTVNFLEKRRWR